MKLSDLKPARALSEQFGIKAIIYGAPGSCKTPSIATAPKPVCLVTEPGMLSTRGLDYACFEAQNVGQIDEFFKWALQSDECKNTFETIAIDSISQLAEIYLVDGLKKHSHGLQAYGYMGEEVAKKCDQLFYQKQFNVVLLAKVTQIDADNPKYRPFLPGKQLNTYIPHLFDEILFASKQLVPGQGDRAVPTLTCYETYNAMARDRSGKLADLEPFNISHIFKKILS